MSSSGRFIQTITFCFFLIFIGFVSGDTNQSSDMPGIYSIISDPTGADVLVQKSIIGKTPLLYIPGTNITVPFTIEIGKSGYENQTITIAKMVKGGENIPISVILKDTPDSGKITIRASPDGCLVSMNGNKGIPVPYTYSDLPVGLFALTVSKTGYKSYVNSKVEVFPDSETLIDVTLISNNERKELVVKTTPPDVDIMVDGIFRGTTLSGIPLTIGPLSDGEHVVKARLTGYQDVETKITTKQDHSTNLHLTMTPITKALTASVLKIKTIPYEVNVLLNGIWVGVTPIKDYLVLDDVPPNRYKLTLNLSGYQNYEEWIFPEEGEIITLEIKLTPVANNSTSPGLLSPSLPSS